MADGSKIEWTDATWNPITGCSVASPGCTNCYAMRVAGGRLKNHPSRKGLTKPSKAGPVWTGDVRFNEAWLDEPLRWTRPRHVFVVAHGDLFHENVPDDWIDRVFGVMALAPQHRFQVLTKRTDRIREYCGKRFGGEVNTIISDQLLWLSHSKSEEEHQAAVDWLDLGKPLDNVLLGFSAEDQDWFDRRWHDVKDLAAAGWRTWVSAEPLLGPIECGDALGADGIEWVVAGGESGHRARPCNPFWLRGLRDQSARAGVPFFFKQWGEWWCQECNPVGTLTQICREHDIGVRPGSPEIGCWDAQGVWRPGGMAGAPPAYTMWKLGKDASGAMLDGRTHEEMPA